MYVDYKRPTIMSLELVRANVGEVVNNFMVLIETIILQILNTTLVGISGGRDLDAIEVSRTGRKQTVYVRELNSL